ncbi:5484_t:CDS:2, partial [Entrophospora sp. SA101]
KIDEIDDDVNDAVLNIDDELLLGKATFEVIEEETNLDSFEVLKEASTRPDAFSLSKKRHLVLFW